MNFTDRETYLAARTQWKRDYAMTSQAIRAARSAFREAQRTFSKVDTTATAAYSAAAIAEGDSRRELQALRVIANEALEELVAAKVEAGRQYNLRKSVAQTPQVVL